MTLGDLWSISTGPHPVPCSPPSADAVCHQFMLVRGTDRSHVTVWFSGAREDDPEPRVAEAVRTEGRSEVEAILGEKTPPRRIIVARGEEGGITVEPR